MSNFVLLSISGISACKLFVKSGDVVSRPA